MNVQLLNVYDIRLEKYQKENFASEQSFWDYINIEEAKTNIEDMENINTKEILFIFGMELQNGRLV